MSETPWLANYGEVPFHLDYPKTSMAEAVLDAAAKYPNYTALSYMGRKIKYKNLAKMIDLCAKSFAAMGINQGQKVTICLPNIPQTVYMLYALNRIGAIVSMVHIFPL
jgi:long-chain acyl-CoA synthetase